uniref:Uncharacterized protein n=1 Tax=viral metagenome TaxID=1070528 RepID=A0A6M3LPL0_9ZZZZ
MYLLPDQNFNGIMQELAELPSKYVFRVVSTLLSIQKVEDKVLIEKEIIDNPNKDEGTNPKTPKKPKKDS